jgi:uncharacterized membrane protein
MEHSTTAAPAPSPASDRAESAWPPLLVLILAIALQVLLPNRLDAIARWVLPSLEAVVLVMLILISPQKHTGVHSVRHRISICVAALASLANGISLVELCHLLLRRGVYDGRQLIIAGGAVWLTNILIFSLWYWILDAGGPGRRAEGSDDTKDFLFPQAAVPEVGPGWRPLYPDYLYVSVTNATTFGPTDAMPLTTTAKMVMGLQSLISLVTIGLVIARAINIL